MANTGSTQNASLEAHQRRAREIAEYRLSVMDGGQRERLNADVLKHRYKVFVLTLLGLFVGAIVLIPFGILLLIEEEDDFVFGSVVLFYGGIACLTGAIAAIVMRRKTKGNPVQNEERIALEKGRVLKEFKTASAMLAERKRVAELVRQGVNERKEGERQSLLEEKNEASSAKAVSKKTQNGIGETVSRPVPYEEESKKGKGEP